MAVLNVLFLELIWRIVSVYYEIGVCNLIQALLPVLEWPH